MIMFIILSMIDGLPFLGVCFIILGCLGWFFAARRDLFLRTFTPYDEDRNETDEKMPKGESFKKGLRVFSIAEFIIGTILLIISIFRSD